MTEPTRVKLEIIKHIAHVTLVRTKKHNALDLEMFKTIAKTIKQLKKDRSIRAVILSADGPNFCTGLDVKALMGAGKSPLKILVKWLPWSSNLAQIVSTGWQKIPVPVIVAIHGKCWGGGLQIAMGADFRICTPDASLSIMEARWGLIPDMGGTLAFRELMRMDVTKELAITGRIVDGQEAQSLGLVTYLSENPKGKALEIAKKIANFSPDAVAGTKKLYNKSWFGTKGMALFRETWYQLKILMGKNQRIKTYNQTHQDEKQKTFVNRKKW